MIEEGKSHLLSWMMVREFRGRKYLSTSINKTLEFKEIAHGYITCTLFSNTLHNFADCTKT